MTTVSSAGVGADGPPQSETEPARGQDPSDTPWLPDVSGPTDAEPPERQADAEQPPAHQGEQGSVGTVGGAGGEPPQPASEPADAGRQPPATFSAVEPAETAKAAEETEAAGSPAPAPVDPESSSAEAAQGAGTDESSLQLEIPPETEQQPRLDALPGTTAGGATSQAMTETGGTEGAGRTGEADAPEGLAGGPGEAFATVNSTRGEPVGYEGAPVTRLDPSDTVSGSRPFVAEEAAEPVGPQAPSEADASRHSPEGTEDSGHTSQDSRPERAPVDEAPPASAAPYDASADQANSVAAEGDPATAVSHDPSGAQANQGAEPSVPHGDRTAPDRASVPEQPTAEGRADLTAGETAPFEDGGPRGAEDSAAEEAPVDGTATGAATASDEDAGEVGSWDDGLIARRVRGATVPAGQRGPADETPEPAAASVRTVAQPGAEDASPQPVAAATEDVTALAAPVRETVPDPRGDEATAPAMDGDSLVAGAETQTVPEQPVGERSGSPAPATEPAPEAIGGSAPTRCAPERVVPDPAPPASAPYDVPAPAAVQDLRLPERIGALRKLIGLSRSRVGEELLTSAGRVLSDAGSRGRLPRAYTTVAIAGATGSGKSSLFNAIAGARLSEPGLCRPTTVTPVSCTWEAFGVGGADGLLDRMGIASSTRSLLQSQAPVNGRLTPRYGDGALDGLILIDMPDHDSAAQGHRERVDQLLRLVDAVVWVVDPEKYADAVLHERYLRPLAGYAEVTFVVLNQTDRLPGDAADTVLDDLRRLLDEDGMALGEHGEAGARVLATSALTGEGVGELRAELGAVVAQRQAAALRMSADLDAVVRELRPHYSDPRPATETAGPIGLTDEAREDFEEWLAAAVGAGAVGQMAERAWLRQAQLTCGTPWARLWHRIRGRRLRGTLAAGVSAGRESTEEGRRRTEPHPTDGMRVARPVVEQAVRTLADQASVGLPEVWRRSLGEAAWRSAAELPDVLDKALHATACSDTTHVQADGGNAADVAMASAALTCGLDEERDPTTAHAGPDAAAPAVEPAEEKSEHRRTGTGLAARDGAGRGTATSRPAWWSAAAGAQWLLLATQGVGALWLLAAVLGPVGPLSWQPVALLLAGLAGGPLLSWACRGAARGPAWAHGQREEWRLRRLVAGHGRSRVLEPVVAELLRYREAREHYVIAAGDGDMREL